MPNVAKPPFIQVVLFLGCLLLRLLLLSRLSLPLCAVFALFDTPPLRVHSQAIRAEAELTTLTDGGFTVQVKGSG